MKVSMNWHILRRSKPGHRKVLVCGRSRARLWRILPIVWLLILAYPMLVAFSFFTQQAPDYTDLPAVLVWLTGMGAPYVVGYSMAWILENVKWWHTLPEAVKFILPMLFSVGISVGSTYLLKNEELIQLLSPYWTLVVGAVLAWLGSQKAYITAHRVGYAPTVKYSG